MLFDSGDRHGGHGADGCGGAQQESVDAVAAYAAGEVRRQTRPALLKRWIGLNLRQLRQEAGKERSEVMQRLGLSRAQVGHLETGERLPSKPVLEILLDFYGKPDRLPDFLRIVEAARKGKNWWDRLSGAVPPWFDLFLGLEAGAAEVFSFDPYVVPGLLQTPAYAEAVIRADPELTDEQVQQRVELRLGRQNILDRNEDPVRLWAIIDESVLHRPRGDTEVMTEQLNHLIKLCERPRIDLQILPLKAGAHLAQSGGFQILKFPSEMAGDPGVVYLEGLVEGRYYEKPDEVALYERALTRLRVQAANQEDSQAMLRQAAQEVHK
ncbi:helix-turn-helix domain-containing protein [Actinopolyspora mortivallis]|uniref:helix-turn-helix domain-containing protein n=1 Tax=Actinopolyspora mortivallis TaxID=33906 RepID=UPI0015E5BDCE|nr:helix-turn-helix transcriptional regulator [Actinopolyspora mortivallis]